MSELARTHHEGGFEAMKEHRLLSLVDMEAGELSDESYEDMVFEFRDSRFVSDTIEITDTMRVRGVLEALQQQPDADLQLPATLKPLQRIDKLLHQSVKIDGEVKPRKQWIPEEEVAGGILSELDKHNHPVAQALKQLRSNYSDEQMNDYDYKLTVINTLKATHERQFREAYDHLISAMRSQS